LLWAILVFSELHGLSGSVYLEVIGGSLLMAAGAVAIASSSASESEYSSWKEAARRETERYSISADYVMKRMQGHDVDTNSAGRSWIDWLMVAVATLIFVILGALARIPQMEIQMGWLIGLSLAMLIVLIAAGLALWRVTRFT
jgi:hypothetical protein